MTLTPLPRTGSRLLAQYLLTCPGCRKPAAAHVDADAMALVRFVCPDRCAVDATAIIDGLGHAHTA